MTCPCKEMREAEQRVATHKPCHACPDGQVWNGDGPTGKTCEVCNGHAALNLDGTPIAPSHTRATRGKR